MASATRSLVLAVVVLAPCAAYELGLQPKPASKRATVSLPSALVAPFAAAVIALSSPLSLHAEELTKEERAAQVQQRAAATGEAVQKGLAITFDAAGRAARAAKEFSEKEETRAALAAARDAVVVSAKAVKEVAESDEAKEFARTAQKAAGKTIDITAKYATEVYNSETTQNNLRRVQAELAKTSAAAIDGLNRQAEAALNQADLPEATKKDIRDKYATASGGVVVAEKELAKAFEQTKAAVESKEAQQNLANAQVALVKAQKTAATAYTLLTSEIARDEALANAGSSAAKTGSAAIKAAPSAFESVKDIASDAAGALKDISVPAMPSAVGLPPMPKLY